MTKPRRRDEVDESESSSHLGKKEVVDIKKKAKHSSITKPRRRDEVEENESSDHLGKKEVVDIKKKAKHSSMTKPRRRDEVDESESSSHLGKKVVVHKKKKGTKDTKQRRREEINESESISNISQKIIIDTKKTKDKKHKIYYEKDKGQKLFNKTIVITPEDKSQNIKDADQKYYNKNISITPSDVGYKRSGIKNINIETRKGKDYDYKGARVERNVSYDDKKSGKVIEVLKGVKYFTKNIVIQPVQSTYESSGKSSFSKEKVYINKSKKSQEEISGKYGTNNTVYSSEKQTHSGDKSKQGEKKAWKIDSKNEDDIFSCIPQSDQDILSESILKMMDNFDDNTKFYHKEIIIQPVFIPPPKILKH
jgi:hypothetical protein